MNPLPDRLNLDHLKKQAKQLIRLYRSRDAAAMARFRSTLPATAGLSDEDLSSRGLRLHDAQSCIAREHGFASWPDLKRYVEVQAVAQKERAVRVLHWAQLLYSGDVSGTVNRANPRVALRILADDPDLVAGDPYLACAIGDERALRQATQADPAWVNLSGGPLRLPPLLAVAHSSLLRVEEFRERLHASAELLIADGADVNQHIHSRWPPGSLSEPDQRCPLSTLYGAAGSNHDPALTKLLLEAGADPNDGESLYHSLENPACTRLLLEHGARIAESNAIYRAMDLDDDTALKLLLEHGGDPNEPARNPPLTDWGSPLAWAIWRRRPRHAKALLDAGADPSRPAADGVSPYQLALRFGLSDVAALLRARIDVPDISDEERFVAACARGDEAEAREDSRRATRSAGIAVAGAIAIVAGHGGGRRRRRREADGQSWLADRRARRRLGWVRPQSRSVPRRCRPDAFSARTRRQMDGAARLSATTPAARCHGHPLTSRSKAATGLVARAPCSITACPARQPSLTIPNGC